ncbi:hypothetical protein KY284_001291 [Solanum tuberosum]|nr:hypothetical protein KY284_001291 [Solanum tuberosum]
MTSKCKRYFNLYRTTENEKLEANVLYLNGLAETRYHSLVLSRGMVTWTDFKEELCDTFDAEHLDDIMEEFKWLEQTESVDMFLGKFEDLKAQMLVRNQPLVESHFVSSFMGVVVKSTSMLTTRPTTYKLSIDIYEYMRNNHLFLDRPGHQCKRKQLNCRIGELEPNQVVEEANAEVEDITLHIIIEGTVKNRNLAILIDSGSTYKFIDEGNVKETGHEVSYCPPVRVTVADKNYVMCTSHCQEFSWKMKDKPH